MGTAHADHQKDVIGLVFSQRLGRQARQKRIDPAQTRVGRPGRGVRRNELQVGQRRDNEPVRLKICELMTARRTIKAALGPSPSARSADRIPPTCGTGRRSAAPLSTSHEHEGANPRSRRLTIRESLRLSLTIRKRPIAQG